MPNFDKDVFELMIEKVIIGEKDSKGKINPRVITFVMKSGNEIKCEDDRDSVTEKISETQNNINQQSSYEAHENYLQKASEPCGSLCVARVKELPIVLEFTSFQDTIMFHKRGRFGLEKVQNCEINVKVVLDMECENI